MTKISLVLGSNGVIGTALSNLIANPYTVSRSQVANFPYHFQADLEIYEQFLKLKNLNPSLIYGLAADTRTRVDTDEGRKVFFNNISIADNMLRYAQDKGCKLFYFSTAALCSNQNFLTSEINPINPFSWYALSKASSEQLCQLYRIKYGVDVVILRLFNIYGANVHKYLVYDVVRKIKHAKLIGSGNITIHSSGSEVRDFTRLDLLLQRVIKLAHSKRTLPPILNIGSGIPLVISQVVDTIISALDFKGEVFYINSILNKYDNPGFYSDNKIIENFMEINDSKEYILNDIKNIALELYKHA